MEQMLEQIFIRVLNMSMTAGVAILVVLAARLLLKKAPRIFSYGLWAAVLFRLLCPVSFTAPLSLLGALQNEAGASGRMEYVPADIGYQMAPELQRSRGQDSKRKPAAGKPIRFRESASDCILSGSMDLDSGHSGASGL